MHSQVVVKGQALPVGMLRNIWNPITQEDETEDCELETTLGCKGKPYNQIHKQANPEENSGSVGSGGATVLLL